MKNTKLFSLVTLLTGALFMLSTLQGCKKETAAETAEDKIMGKKWQLKSLISSEPIDLSFFGCSATLTDWLSCATLYPACSKDDYTEFKANNVSESNEGATKCTATDPQVTTGFWDIMADGKTMIVGSDDDKNGTITPAEKDTLTFKEFSSSKIVFEQAGEDGEGNPVSFTGTWQPM